ncbi:MAG: ribonuclease R [Bacteroidales bacterium]|nr:ribonuclease R [Bacteroidales bacterium]
MAKRKADPEEKKNRLSTAIREVLTQHQGESFNYKQITEMIGLKSKDDRLDVQDMLFELADLGVIKEGVAGKYCIPGKETTDGAPIVVGVVDMSASGFAYVIADDKEQYPDDIFVPANALNTALDDDKVEVAIIKKRKGRAPEGKIVKIIERKREQFVGILEYQPDGCAFVRMDSRTLGGKDIYIPSERVPHDANYKKVVAKIVDWPSTAKSPFGEIIDVLGEAGDNQTEMHAILAEFGLPYGYPDEVAKEAEKIDPGITPAEIAKRLDMRDVVTFTIDPRDAKDFDDALSIRKLDSGNWEVGVHIADVTHYVQPHSIIDEEGYKRATSVYLVDRTIPMLPERLSNFLCSLRQDEEKLTYSVVFILNDNAEILGSKISKTVIKSNRRFTYEEAQALIEAQSDEEAKSLPGYEYRNEVLKLNELAQIIRKRRFDEGAIGFERVEPRFEIDETGKPISVYFKEAKEANKLIEEFMLLANKKVAECIGKDEINVSGKKRTPKTFVYRVHDQPNEEKYNKFATFVKRFGYEAQPKKGEEINDAVNRILKEVKGRGEQNMVETLAVRTMAKACYTTKNIGHYGLAFDFYTHFTSPIRRYPDMMVHRLLHSYLNGGKSANTEAYEDFCKHCSEQEILASDAERASIKYKQVEFLIDHIGEDYEATISGVTEWGIYAEIDENKCEGMIPLRDLEDDTYYFDEDNYCAVGRNTNRKYQLGDKIKIRIANANLEKKQLDFTIAGSPLKDIEIQNQKLKEAGKRPGIAVGASSHDKLKQAKSSMKTKASGKPPKKVLKKAKKESKKKGKKKK